MLVDNFLKDPDGYNKVLTGEHPKASSERDERAIVRVVKNSYYSFVSKIKASARVGALIFIVRRVILNHNFHQKKKLGHLLLSVSHKAVRLEFAQQRQI